MTTRLIIAYSLIALIALATAAGIWWKVYNSPQRAYARDRARQAQNSRKRDEAAAVAGEVR